MFNFFASRKNNNLKKIKEKNKKITPLAEFSDIFLNIVKFLNTDDLLKLKAQCITNGEGFNNLYAQQIWKIIQFQLKNRIPESIKTKIILHEDSRYIIIANQLYINFDLENRYCMINGYGSITSF
jgi:hypothetical protein